MPEFRIITPCPKCQNRTLVERTEDIDRRRRRQQRDKTDWIKHYLTCPKCGWEMWAKSDAELMKELKNMYHKIKLKANIALTGLNVYGELTATRDGVRIDWEKGVKNSEIEEGSIRLCSGLRDDFDGWIYADDVVAIYNDNGDEVEKCVVIWNAVNACFCLIPFHIDNPNFDAKLRKLPLGDAMDKLLETRQSMKVVGDRDDYRDEIAAAGNGIGYPV